MPAWLASREIPSTARTTLAPIYVRVMPTARCDRVRLGEGFSFRRSSQLPHCRGHRSRLPRHRKETSPTSSHVDTTHSRPVQ